MNVHQKASLVIKGVDSLYPVVLYSILFPILFRSQETQTRNTRHPLTLTSTVHQYCTDRYVRYVAWYA